jgi:hypothetical protein
VIAANRKRTHGAGTRERRDRIEAFEHQLHAPRHQVVDRRRAAFIWHVDDVGAGHEFEQLATDVARRAVTRRGIEKLAGILFGVVDQLRHRMERCRRRNREQKLATRRKRDGLKVARDVVRQRHHQMSGDSKRADRSHAQGIAIRR